MSVHWAKADIRLRASGSEFDARVRPVKPTWGMVKSLALIGAGPVGLVRTQKFGIQSEKPTLDGVPARSSTSVFGVPAQPVDATQALNLSAGVSNCKVSRGRSFS